MSQRLKEWAMQQPEFQASEREAERSPHTGPRDSIESLIESLEAQLPRSRQLREKLRRERLQRQARSAF